MEKHNVLILPSTFWLLTLFIHAQAPQLPTEIAPVRFNSGQAVVPYFEGWIRNPDATFDLVFGYFNRNWKQELAIPAGPDNNVDPAGFRGDPPTYFLPRRHRWIFRVRVPADFGNKEVTWTITANSHAEKAYGNLQAAQEITERVVRTNGGLDPGDDDANEPPSIKFAPVETANTRAPVTLRVSITDDGLPKPRPVRNARPATGAFGAQIDRAGPSGPRGQTVTWLQYGGPAKVNFENAGPVPVVNGQATTNARFAEPGTYHLRVTASDGALSTTTDVIVTVPN